MGSTTTRGPRLCEPPHRLLRRVLGARAVWRDKGRRLLAALRSLADERRIRERLERLHALGRIDAIPTRLQRFVGALDMLRFYLLPFTADYCRQKRISLSFQALLRLLDDPASLVDPTGLCSERDTIIGHLLQVVHADPSYDLALLEAWPDGLAEMESQLLALLAGAHPRTASLRATVEDLEYHARLLIHVREALRPSGAARPVLCEEATRDPRFVRLSRQFGTLEGALRYFARMPQRPLDALRHLWTVRDVPAHLLVEHQGSVGCPGPERPGYVRAGMSARNAEGVVPVHRRKARWKLLGSEKPSKNAISARDRRASRR